MKQTLLEIAFGFLYLMYCFFVAMVVVAWFAWASFITVAFVINAHAPLLALANFATAVLVFTIAMHPKVKRYWWPFGE